MCACVCVCERERERERNEKKCNLKKKRKGEKKQTKQTKQTKQPLPLPQTRLPHEGKQRKEKQVHASHFFKEGDVRF